MNCAYDVVHYRLCVMYNVYLIFFVNESRSPEYLLQYFSGRLVSLRERRERGEEERGGRERGEVERRWSCVRGGDE